MPEVCYIQFTARNNRTAPGAKRDRIHAAFLKMVQRFDPGLAAHLHRQTRYKPFALSILPLAKKQKNTSAFTLRLSCLTDRLAAEMRQLAAGEHLLTIGEARFAMEKIIIPAVPQPGQVSYQELVYQALGQCDRAKKIRINFESPTAFRSGRTNLLFPLPGLIFTGLMNKWNEHSGLKALPACTAEQFNELIIPGRYQLQSTILRFNRYRQVGFTGYCEYLLPSGLDIETRCMILLLTSYIFYAGIGYKTTMGMGRAQGIVC
jgi:CRISPR-associated endoribonuclease Cas6